MWVRKEFLTAFLVNTTMLVLTYRLKQSTVDREKATGFLGPFQKKKPASETILWDTLH